MQAQLRSLMMMLMLMMMMLMLKMMMLMMMTRMMMMVMMMLMMLMLMMMLMMMMMLMLMLLLMMMLLMMMMLRPCTFWACWPAVGRQPLKSGQQALWTGNAPGRRPLALAIGLRAPTADLAPPTLHPVFYGVFCSSTKTARFQK